MRIAVLGCGRVGSAIALDLLEEPDFEVVVYDREAANLSAVESAAETRVLDLASRKATRDAVAEADLVVSAVPGPMGFQTLRSILEEGRSVVDISYFAEDALQLDELAREHGATALVDCGIAPGCSNLMAGDIVRQSRTVERFACYVGGLPEVRIRPYEYWAPFSPVDVIEEYTRPARFRRNGTAVTLPALTEVEELHFEGIGTLEAFNTDGLRTLLGTLEIPNMVEKTLRYPGHAELMRVFRDTGFFDPKPLEGLGVSPLQMSSRLLFRAWSHAADDRDLTVMRIEASGARSDGLPFHRRWDMLDRYDDRTETSSMARTTGYTCTGIVRLVARGEFERPGIHPPEVLGLEGLWPSLRRHLEQRGIQFVETDLQPE